MLLFSLKNVGFKDIIHYPDIEIPEGCATFISGESGSGKSTLLKLLNGVLSADDGEILYAGKPIDAYDPVTLRRDVLLCGQSAYLFEGSVAQNFEEFYRYRDLPAPGAGLTHRYLKICAADFTLESACATMSGGEKQRVFTAICLSFMPRALLLDEPTSALDDATANTLMANMTAFCNKNGITLIVVSHNQQLLGTFADQIISLAGGSRLE